MSIGAHRYKIGQQLRLNPGRWSMRAAARTAECKILRLMPADVSGEWMYRVQCANELFERNVRESELLSPDPS